MSYSYKAAAPFTCSSPSYTTCNGADSIGWKMGLGTIFCNRFDAKAKAYFSWWCWIYAKYDRLMYFRRKVPSFFSFSCLLLSFPDMILFLPQAKRAQKGNYEKQLH